MPADEFFDLVERMRKAQADYFRTRAPGRLAEAKDLERRVDAAVKGWRESARPGLFDGDPE